VPPPLPLRQWVFSLPKRTRPFLPHDPRLAGDVLRVLLRSIRITLRRACPSTPTDAQLGAVSFLHRFGSALNRVPARRMSRGVRVPTSTSASSSLTASSPSATTAAFTFHEATHLSADDVLRLERTLQRRVLRLFQRRGLLDEHTVENMLTWQASDGFSLDASVRIHGSDSAGRARLLRPGTRRRRVARGRPSRWSACAIERPGDGVERRHDQDVLADGAVCHVRAGVLRSQLRVVEDPPQVAVTERRLPTPRRVHL
jgi:hypothetical protein